MALRLQHLSASENPQPAFSSAAFPDPTSGKLGSLLLPPPPAAKSRVPAHRTKCKGTTHGLCLRRPNN